MGIISSSPQVEYYTDSYHITDTFSNHTEWKQTVKRMNHVGVFPFHQEQVNLPIRFGSQPYIIYAIHDKEMKDTIQGIAQHQPHVSACNCIFIFCARTFRSVYFSDVITIRIIIN